MQVVFKHKQLLHGNAVGENNSEKKAKDKAMGVEQESILPQFPGKYRKGRETSDINSKWNFHCTGPNKCTGFRGRKMGSRDQSKPVGIASKSVAEGYGK